MIAVFRLYFYTNDVVEIVKIKPSIRGELEISDINTYIKSNKLKIIKLNDNVFWSIQELMKV